MLNDLFLTTATCAGIIGVMLIVYGGVRYLQNN